MGSLIYMRGAGTGGSENALASIDVPNNGDLVGVEWSCHHTLNTDQERGEFQLSFGSVISTANDSRQVISTVFSGLITQVSAAGIILAVANHYVQLPDIPVNQGERIYVHGTATAGVVSVFTCMLHFSFQETRTAQRRR